MKPKETAWKSCRRMRYHQWTNMIVVFRKSNHHRIESERETQLAPRSFRGAKVKPFGLAVIQPSLLPLPPPMRVKADAQAPLGATWTAAQGQIGRSILGFGEQPQSRGVVAQSLSTPNRISSTKLSKHLNAFS